MDTPKEEEEIKRKKKEEDEEMRKSQNMVMGDAFDTGLPGGLDGDFGTMI